MRTVSHIQGKLDGGRFPHSNPPRVRGGPDDGETCDACEERALRHRIRAKLAEGLQFVVAAFLIDCNDQRLPPRARHGGRAARVISTEATRAARRRPR
jgi:hypothetical protein